MSPRAVRLAAGDAGYGGTCPECACSKAPQHPRCKRCDTERRRDAAYWLRRTCPKCGGPKGRRVENRQCRRCADAAMREKPRSSPVVVPAGHVWRRRRFGREAGPRVAA